MKDRLKAILKNTRTITGEIADGTSTTVLLIAGILSFIGLYRDSPKYHLGVALIGFISALLYLLRNNHKDRWFGFFACLSVIFTQVWVAYLQGWV